MKANEGGKKSGNETIEFREIEQPPLCMRSNKKNYFCRGKLNSIIKRSGEKV